VEVVLVYAPHRLALKYAYKALLIEEFAKAGTGVMFVRGQARTPPRMRCWCSSKA
jgi:site-specific DNA recombinase